MKVVLDDKSGFCFGVRKAIGMAEKELQQKSLYCLGDIVHNENEVQRLADLGLKVISRKEYFLLSDCTVLLRAHGEPAEVFDYAQDNNINLIDGTCPVVAKLQQKVRNSYNEMSGNGTIVIFGKPDHPEVMGLNGQIEYNAKIVQSEEDLETIDFSKPITLFSQTTMSREKYQDIKKEIESRLASPELLDIHDTICGQVANRGPWLQDFSKKVDAIVFAGGKKSSNSKVLFAQCKAVNINSFFVSNVSDLKDINFDEFDSVGVCGATSTPQWLLKDIANALKNF